MTRVFILLCYFLMVTAFLLVLTLSCQGANAAVLPEPDIENIHQTFLDFMDENKAESQSLLPDLERLIQNYPAESDRVEQVVPLYLMQLSSDELVRGGELFLRLRKAGVSLSDNIFIYLDTLFEEEKWWLKTLDEFLEQGIADIPEEQALRWLYEKLLEQRGILDEGIYDLEQTQVAEAEGVLHHFLIAQLKARQPFMRWPAADRYLLGVQKEHPETLRTLQFYRSLLQLQFAPLEKVIDDEPSRSFLGMKLFASAGEMPTLQEEVDRLLATFESIEQKQTAWQERYDAIKEQEQLTLEQCEETVRLHKELDRRCKETLRVNNQQIHHCNDEYDRHHAAGIHECNQRNGLTAERNRIVSHRNTVQAERKNTLFQWWQRCIGWNYPCPNGQDRICYPFDIPNHGCWQWAVTEQIWLDEHSQWRKEYAAWQSEVSYWGQICDQRRDALSAWKSRCLGLESSASQQNARCRNEQSASQTLLNDCQNRLNLLTQQKSELKKEKATLAAQYEDYLQKKTDLRARIETLQAEWESLQPIVGHCRADDCPKLGFPQAPLDDFAHTVGETYLAMAGPGGKLKAGSIIADTVEKFVTTGLSKIEIRTIFTSAQVNKKGSTAVGHALSKHAGRNPDTWGRITGSMKTWNDQAMKHLGEIISAPGDFKKVQSNGIFFLEKRLSDGRGVRLNMDHTFKTFLD